MPHGFINAEDFAFGDGSNDDANALNQAANAAQTEGKWLWVPRTANSYDIGSQVTIPAGVGVKCYGKLRMLTSMPISSPAVTIGETGVANRFREIELRIEHEGVGTSSVDWTLGHVGVQLYNPQHCVIRIFASRGFQIGLEIIGDGDGGAFNNDIWLFDLADCRYAVQLDAHSSSAVKHNRLWGGRWVVSGTVGNANANIERGLARFVSSDASAAADVRGNVWEGPGPCVAPRDSTEGTRKLFYLHTQGPRNVIHSCQDGASLSISDGDAQLVVDGAQASNNLLHLGDWTGSPAKTIAKINSAPSNQNGVWSRRDIAANAGTIGGVVLT